jgi:LPXTG-motif cell wall-anchored protein
MHPYQIQAVLQIEEVHFLQLRKSSTVLLAGVSIAFLAFAMLSPVAFASTGTQFAAYQISGAMKNHAFSAVVNESATPASNAGFSSLTLQLGSTMGNLSYSKIVNSTQVLFPYFPGMANQSLSFQYHNYSISLAVAQVGTKSETYQSHSYALAEYTFSVWGARTGGTAMSATGNASVFPSGLVYSATIVANGTDTIQVQLLGTNLDLNSASGASQTTSIAVAGGAGSILAGVGAFVFYKRKNTSTNAKADDKPLYHVD